MNRDQVKKQLKAVQKQNYSHIVNKNSLSLSDKRDKFLREQEKGLASVKLQDLVAPIDYKAKKQAEITMTRGALSH